MKVLACQLDLVWEDRDANYRKLKSLLHSGPAEGDRLIVLPEMFSTGFSMNTEATTESKGGETEQFLTGLAKDLQSWVVGGLVLRHQDGRPRNEALAVSPQGEILGRYAKMFPFSLGGEQNHHVPGDNLITFPCGPLIASPFICYDLRFPEVFRSAAQRGTELFIVIANWPSKRTHHWVNLLQARAIENQAFVIGVNRCGSDPNLQYDGRTLIINPLGEILADAGGNEQILEAELNVEELRSWRNGFPALRDIRREWIH